MLLLLAVLVGSLGYLGWTAFDHHRGAMEYESAIKIVDIPAVLPAPESGGELSSWEIPEELLDILASINLESLQEGNDEVVGWIVIPDTVLSYPLLWTSDNQYYLTHTWTRVQSSVGAIFLECKCSPDLTDFNTIIYGHRMRNGSMFGNLRDYNRMDYWEAHPTVYLVSNTTVYAYDIFAAFQAGVREVVYHLDVQDPEEKQAVIDFALSKNVLNTGIVPTTEDKILTLSTCTGMGHAARWIVQGVLRAQAPTF